MVAREKPGPPMTLANMGTLLSSLNKPSSG